MSSREFDVRQPNDNEEEKIILAAHHNLNDNDGVIYNGGGATAPSSYLQVIDEDEEEENVDIISSAHDVHKTKPTGQRQSSRGHFPPPSISKSPVVSGGRMKEHLKQNWKSFMSSSSSSSSHGKSSEPPTISYEGGSFDERNQYEQTKHKQQQHALSPSSLVVCGVDGVVYTVDAFTGQLRGMFASGPALVQSSSPSEEDMNSQKEYAFNEYSSDAGDDVDGFSNIPLENENDYDFDSAIIASNVVQVRKERVVPGLDGRLYSVEELLDMDDGSCNDESAGGSCSSDDGNIIPRFGSITPLPISAMDVVDSPISTCQPGTSDTDQRQCGIIVGSKKTTIYAIDPTTGKVRWQQDPFGKAGGRGYTTRPPKSARGATVLLQREDYAVRHLDTDGGNDVWKVELGRFSALDFDLDSGSQSGQQETSSAKDDTMFDGGPAAGVGSRRAAAAAASVNDKKKSSVPPILGRKKTSLHDFESDFSDERHKENVFDDFDHDHSFRGFPSIAFGEVSLFSIPCHFQLLIVFFCIALMHHTALSLGWNMPRGS